MLQRKIIWSDFWRADIYRIRFLIQGVYDTLPSPTNLHTWGESETPSCPLCAGRGSLQHLLSSCPKALTDGCYRWHHDQVLKAVAETVTTAIQSSKHHPRKKTIPFLKAGEKPCSLLQTRQCILSTAPDWQLRVDLGKQLKFPDHIAETTLCPDMIVFSDSTKQVIMWELTVPWEEHMEEAHERKLAKYQELVEQRRSRGWRAHCKPVEVGCRGFAGRSLCKALDKEGRPVACCCWDPSWDLINPGWVTWARGSDVERPETPYDSRNITDDASQSIREMYLAT